MAKTIKLQVPGAIATGKLKKPKSIRKMVKKMNASGNLEANAIPVSISQKGAMEKAGFFEIKCSSCGATGMSDKPTSKGYMALCPKCAKEWLKRVE